MVEQITAQMLSQGVLGIGCIVFFWLYMGEKKELRTITEKRIEEAKLYGQIVSNNTVALNDISRAVLTKVIIKQE